MDTIPVIVKHSGKKYNIDLDPTTNGETFKYQVYSITGVEPERQRIIVKGGQLKDDSDLSKLNLKPGHQFMLMGTPSGTSIDLAKPKEATKFLEDMTEAEAAQSEGATPAGLQNLGNTCYLNSTLQAMRAIPELQEELRQYKATSSTAGRSGQLADLSQFGLGGLGASTDLTGSLRDLYRQMGETQEGFPPLMFLNAFRSAYPQFAERSRDGRGFAQQDAEEAWSQIITTLKQKLKTESGTGIGTGDETSTSTSASTFIDQYLGGRFSVVEECVDPAAKEAGEKPTPKPDEPFYKLNCHVASKEVNHLLEGVSAALSSTYTKHSPTLDRDAEYATTSRISRLPKYLPVHFVRFFWKRDVNKKAKILRKVTFPHELDLAEHCTEELKGMLIPVRDKVRDLRKEELDVERARKRQKRMAIAAAAAEANGQASTGDPDDKTAPSASASKSTPSTSSSNKDKDKKKGESTNADATDTEMSDISYKTDAQIEAERAAQILAAKRDLLAAVNPKLSADKGANQTGLYELRGVVTHQGASADSGHYTAYVKKEGRKDVKTGKREPEDGKWWWFNDEKVSEVDEDKISSLAGGGESHSALILLYRAVELPVVEDEDVKMQASAT